MSNGCSKVTLSLAVVGVEVWLIDVGVNRWIDSLPRGELYRDWASLDQRRKAAAVYGAAGYLLSRQLACRADELYLERNEFGRPGLRGIDACDLSFSRAGDWAAIAISVRGPVGIDLVSHEAHFDFEPIVRQMFHPSERNRLNASDCLDRRTMFFEMWAAKEAYLKGVGLGLSAPLNGFSVEAVSGGWTVCPRAAGFDSLGKQWQVAAVDAVQGYSLALAYSK